MNECLNCGAPSGDRKYCSKRCGDRYSEKHRTRTCAEPGCTRPHRAKGYCGSHYNQHFRTAEDRLQTVPCTICATPCMKDKRDYGKRRPVCSDMCRCFLTHGHWPISELPPWSKPQPTRRELALAKLATVALLPPTRKRWYAGQCKRCGAWFVDDQPAAAWCSNRCGRKAGRAIRRAVERGAFVEHVSPEAIFKRDKWTCKLCGKRVARTKVVPHPKAPVLDHIVPPAKGGKHERSNVQCAHFMCNSMKGDRAANDQLMLIG